MSKTWVEGVYGDVTIQDRNRLQYPQDGDPTRLVEQILATKAMEGYVVLVDGAFDVPHICHEGYLRHVRALAGAAYILRNHAEVTSEATKEVIADSRVTVVTTVDADCKIAHKKGGRAAKGGVPRPIYPWIARAERILGYTFAVTDDGLHRPVVDIATVEGDTAHEGTPFESSLHLAEYLREQNILDGIVIYGEHAETEREAYERGLDPIVIPENVSYGTNPQTDTTWSSSALIRRAQGESVMHPVTHPTDLPSFNPCYNSALTI